MTTKDDERDITDLTEIKSNGSIYEMETTFSPFLSTDRKLSQFSTITTPSDSQIVQTIENDFRNTVSRYTFDRKCIRSPSPTSSNLFFNSTDLLTNRIGQFYPRPNPHVFQHHHHHHLSKHFHQMLNHHNFLQTNPISVPIERSPNRNSINNTALNLNANYNQTHHNLHPDPTRQN